MNQERTVKPFIKFQSIGNSKDWTTNVRRNHSKRTFIGLTEDKKPIFEEHHPRIKMQATTKVHGTHGDVVVWPDGTVIAQSRNRIVDIYNDNQGWANFVFGTIGEDYWRERAGELNAENSVIVFAFEWAGQGIQSVVGVNQLKRFALSLGTIIVDNADEVEARHGQVDEEGNVVAYNMSKRVLPREMWLMDEDLRIFSTAHIASWVFDFDFEPTTGNVNELFTDVLPRMLDRLENDCPVAKYIAKRDGVELEGENIGEGFVFSPVDPQYGSRDWFKYKGEKHARAGQKVKKQFTPIDPIVREKVDKFVSDVCTESRLRQGVHYLQEMSKPVEMRSLGEYLKWVFEDIKKEETDNLLELGLEFKQVNKSISNTARGWFIEFYHEFQ